MVAVAFSIAVAFATASRIVVLLDKEGASVLMKFLRIVYAWSREK